MADTPHSRTLRQRTTGDPLNPNDTTATMVKPAELVDIVELTPLTLADRRIYNLLMANAWKRIDEDIMHWIPKAALRGAHGSNDRLIDSLRRLQGALVQVRIVRDGRTYIRSIQLLGTTDRPEDGDDETGTIYYRFPSDLREIIQQSDIFARLSTEVMFCFGSKYALALWEMIQKRGNLKSKNTDEFTVDEFRKFLGIPRGRLIEFADLRRKAIAPAVKEVNAFSSHMVQVDGIRHGKKITKVRLIWFPKDEQGLRAAYAEVQKHRAGRKARMSGLIETIAGPAAVPDLNDDLGDL
jgi:hypothetical protein